MATEHSDPKMSSDRTEEESVPTGSGGGQTTLDPATRRTGSDALESDARPSAAPEAPGDKNTEIEGDPNQGTESR